MPCFMQHVLLLTNSPSGQVCADASGALVSSHPCSLQVPGHTPAGAVQRLRHQEQLQGRPELGAGTGTLVLQAHSCCWQQEGKLLLGSVGSWLVRSLMPL